MNLQAQISLENRGFVGPAREAQSAIKGVTSGASGIGRIAGPMLKAAGVTAGLTAGIAGVGKAISAAAKNETLSASLRVLMKDADAAGQMLRQLNEFSDVTPFEPEPVQEAGRALLAFGFGAKEVKPLLADIGDLASAFGVDIGEVAGAMGRLRSGQFGEAFERFRSMGIGRQDLEAQGLEFDASGQFQGDATEAIEAVRAVIKTKFGGTMAEMSSTTEGLLSTLKGGVTAIFRELGQPINDALRPMLTQAIGLIKSAADNIKSAISILQGAQTAGNLGELIGASLQVAVKGAVNTLYRGFVTTITTAGTLLGEAVHLAFASIKAPSFWDGVLNTLKSVFLAAAAVLHRAVAGLLAQIPGLGGEDEFGAADLARSEAAMLDKASQVARGQAGKDFAKEDSQDFIGQIKDSMAAVSEVARQSMAGTPDLFDTTSNRATIAAIIASAIAAQPAAAPDKELPGAATDPAKATNTGSRGSSKDIASDQLARVGLFVGGSGGSIAQANRQTADNTRQANTYLKGMHTALANNPPTPTLTPAWA